MYAVAVILESRLSDSGTCGKHDRSANVVMMRLQIFLWGIMAMRHYQHYCHSIWYFRKFCQSIWPILACLAVLWLQEDRSFNENKLIKEA